MNSPIGVALLSAAHLHAPFWAEAAVDTDGARLVCVWDDDPDRGASLATQVGVPFVGSLREVLNRPDVDAVAIQSQTARHADLTCRAVAAGKHVLCEKPMATTLADCDRMIAAVGIAGVTYMQGFPKRLDPVSHALLAIVRAQQLGEVSLVRVRHGHGWGLTQDFGKSWFVQQREAGGGAFLDEGVHIADFLLWLFGAPERVVGATMSSLATSYDVEDTGIAVFRYPSGMIAEIVSSWAWPAATNSIEVYGTRGTAIVSGTDGASRKVTGDDAISVFRADRPERGFEALDVATTFKGVDFHGKVMREFVRCLIEGSTPPTTADDGRRALAMILAAYRVAETGQADNLDWRK